MDELPQECVVYYLNENILSAARLHGKIKQIDERMDAAREDIALLEITEQALRKIENRLRLMRWLASVSMEDSPEVDRDFLDRRFQSLKQEIADIIASAEHNGVNLLSGGCDGINGIVEALGKAIL